MTRVRSSELLSLLFLSCLTASRALAADAASAPPLRLRIDTALSTSPSGPTVDTFAGVAQLGADYRFESGLGASLEGGLTALSLEVDAERARRGVFPGNLLLGVSLSRTLGAHAFRARLQLGAPLALYPGGIDDNRLAELAYVVGAVALGFREPFLWQPNVVPLVMGADTTLRLLDGLTLRARLSPAYLVSVNQRPSRAALSAFVDAEAALGSSAFAHVGLAYFVSTLPLENRQRDQLALRFGAGAVALGQRWLFDVSLGLDAPYGAFEDAPHAWWGAGVSTELSFDGGR